MMGEHKLKPNYKCYRCGYSWLGYKKAPIRCPKCNRHDWWSKIRFPRKKGVIGIGKVIKALTKIESFCPLNVFEESLDIVGIREEYFGYKYKQTTKPEGGE